MEIQKRVTYVDKGKFKDVLTPHFSLEGYDQEILSKMIIEKLPFRSNYPAEGITFSLEQGTECYFLDVIIDGFVEGVIDIYFEDVITQDGKVFGGVREINLHK